jgi:uncharacterized cupin superfamily protein
MLAIEASEAPLRKTKSSYPSPFAERMGKRQKRPLGDLFGLKNFGVNLTTLEPGGESALMHRHTTQDEFVFIVSGTPILRTDQGEVQLGPGMCAGFPAKGLAHQLVNRSSEPVVYLEVGDRSPGDSGTYPEDDLQAVYENGAWKYLHADGTPY